MDYKGLIKIISGGQRGADRAGLDAAKSVGIATGGTAPKGWRVCLYDGSDGSDPDLASLGLVEHQSSDYPPRTKQNVRDSDGTVWFGYSESPGGRLTIGTCKKLGKPCILNPSFEDLREWVAEKEITILNVAGNRSSEDNPDIYTKVYFCIQMAFKDESA
jgi:hypothetical protein